VRYIDELKREAIIKCAMQNAINDAGLFQHDLLDPLPTSKKFVHAFRW
jgi:hypothetical protein